MRYMLELSGQVFWIVAFDLDHLEQKVEKLFSADTPVTLIGAEKV